MIELFGIIDAHDMPMLIKYDAKLSLVPLYVSRDTAGKFLREVVVSWPNPEGYRVIEWDLDLLQKVKSASDKLGMEAVIRVHHD